MYVHYVMNNDFQLEHFINRDLGSVILVFPNIFEQCIYRLSVVSSCLYHSWLFDQTNKQTNSNRR